MVRRWLEGAYAVPNGGRGRGPGEPPGRRRGFCATTEFEFLGRPVRGARRGRPRRRRRPGRQSRPLPVRFQGFQRPVGGCRLPGRLR